MPGWWALWVCWSPAARFLVGTRHRDLILVSMLLGALLVTVCDLLGRVIFAPLSCRWASCCVPCWGPLLPVAPVSAERGAAAVMELRAVTAGYGGADVVRGSPCAFSLGGHGAGGAQRLRQVHPAPGRGLAAPGAGPGGRCGHHAGWSSRAFARRRPAPVPACAGGHRRGPSAPRALPLSGLSPALWTGGPGGSPLRYGAGEVLELADRNVARLSGGQRQKVYLAMALAQDTPVLLLDEPTTFLDIGCQLELARLMRETAAEGKAVVMVLHDLNLALGCAHRVAVMEEGRLRAWGTPAEIYAGGALEEVFGVRVHRVELENGTEQYLFTQRGL